MSSEESQPEEIAVPMCEVCYLIENTFWEPESVDSYGQVVMRLTEIIIPPKVNTNKLEVCEECGGITIAGIYELKTVKELEERKNSDEYSYWREEDPTSFILNLYPESEE